MTKHGLEADIVASQNRKAEAAARARGSRVMRLEVDASNARAIARYRKAGYAAFGRRPGYYENGADALRFQKQLSTAIGGAS